MRVLQVLGTVGLGGAESRVMDIYRHMDREKIQFDFLVTEGTVDHYSGEIESLGGRVYHLPSFRVYNYFKYVKACRRFFSEHVKDGESEYAAVHGHMTSTAAIYLPIAKEYKVPLTIAHARSAGVDPGIKGKVTRFLRRNLKKKCDLMLACSDEAGDSVFGKDSRYKFVPNAVDMSEYAYDEIARFEVRQRYDIGDKLLVGHVGSFRYAKNHEFILEVFACLHKSYPNSVLMLVGDGELRSATENKAAELGISDSVIFTGDRKPVSMYYQAFDVLLFPSRYEGMPGTVVEAQASGLPCVISSSVTEQVIFTDRVRRLPLSLSANRWADAVVKAWTDSGKTAADRAIYRGNVRALSGGSLSSTIYDVRQQVGFYEKLYEEADIW